jgi:hypothetical protein
LFSTNDSSSTSTTISASSSSFSKPTIDYSGYTGPLTSKGAAQAKAQGCQIQYDTTGVARVASSSSSSTVSGSTSTQSSSYQSTAASSSQNYVASSNSNRQYQQHPASKPRSLPAS